MNMNLKTVWALLILFAGVLGSPLASAAMKEVGSDRPNRITFEPQTAKFVRFIIHATNSGAPCIDELEVYGTEEPKRNLALSPHAVPSASSCIAGYPVHKVAHLNDGNYGNSYSWISAGEPDAWAQIELPEPVLVNRVAILPRPAAPVRRPDADTAYSMPIQQDGATWTTVAEVAATAAAVNLNPQARPVPATSRPRRHRRRR